MNLIKLIIALPFCFDTLAQGVESSKVFPVDKLKEDYKIFRDAITDAHPAAFRYISREGLNLFYDSISTSINSPMTDEAFTRLLLLSVAKIRCAHTIALFPVTSWFSNPDIKKRTILPLNFKFIDNQAFVSRSFSKVTSAKIIGQRVISINNVPIETYIDQFLPLLNSDGYISSSRNEQLSIKFKDYFSYFIARPDTFSLELEQPFSHDYQLLKIPAIAISELLEGLSLKDYLPFRFKLETNEVAYLRMDDFLISNLKKAYQISYKKYLRRSFMEMEKKKIKYLIIDVRNNGGGNGEVGASLFSHIAYKSFIHERSTVIKYKKFNQHYVKYAKKGDRLDGYWGIQTDTGFTLTHFYSKLKRRWKPKINSFKGTVTVLSGGNTYSAGSAFVGLFKAEGRGAIIGDETGGYAFGPTGYLRLELELPNTKTRVIIPLVIARLNIDAYTFGQGVTPIFKISDEERIHSLLEGYDPELKKALELFEK
ncbi:MAG TPA: S41 family peptidase [Cytophagaceae bacterium]|jgi:hypothetical protein